MEDYIPISLLLLGILILLSLLGYGFWLAGGWIPTAVYIGVVLIVVGGLTA